jgi:hypothetical protein
MVTARLRRMRDRRRWGLVSAVSMLVAFIVALSPVASVHAAPGTTSAYVATSPTRVLDTRLGLNGSRLAPGGRLDLTIAGRAPVPVGATAVVLNLTVTEAGRAGFVTAWPAGQAMPLASAINYERPGQTIANLVTVPLGDGGAVSFFSQNDVELVADVQGYFVGATSASSGRFLPLEPIRVIDTRLPGTPHPGALAAGETMAIDLRPLGVAPDAAAAVLKVTVVDAAGAGFWTVFPGGTRPEASNVNVDVAGQTIPNQVIATLAGGVTNIYAQTGGHLVVDLVGWFTGPSAPVQAAGLFTPVAPTRLVDTREITNGPGMIAGRNQKVEVNVGGRATIPTTGVAAVVVNATVTETLGEGYFSLWAARTYRPNVSSLNAVAPGQTFANHVISLVSEGGFNFYTQNGAHLVADVTGWFSGTPTPSVLPPAVPIPGPFGPVEAGGYIYQAGTFVGGYSTNVVGPQYVPFRWNPCRPIRYAVNLNGFSAGYRSVIAEAIERVGTATGIDFQPVGDTSFTPTSADGWGLTSTQMRDHTGPYDVVIALVDESMTDLVPGSVGGLSSSRTSYFRGVGEVIANSVVIDIGDTASDPDWVNGGAGPTLLHELGHSVGLGHVFDNAQLMYPSSSPFGPPSFAAGDLRGLWQVGAVRGCVVA